MKEKYFIRDHGLFTTLVVAMIGIGVFYGPSFVARIVGQDSWICGVIMGICLMIFFLVIHKLLKINDYADIVTILKRSYGDILGNIIAIIYSFAMIVALSVSLRAFADVIHIYLLPKTSIEFIIISMIFIGVYLVRGGLANLVNFSEVSFWLMFIPAFIILFLNLPNAEFGRLLPMFNHSAVEYGKGVLELFFLVNGFSIAFILLPYVRKRENINKILVRSSIFTALFYVITIIFVISTLSVDQTAEKIFPTITMLKSINVRSGLLERWDGLVMGLWVFFYFTTFASTYYFSSYIVKNIFKIEDIKISSIIYAPIIYVLALYPDSMPQIYNVGLGLSKAIFISVIVIVIFISYFISLIKKKRGEKYES